MYWKKTPVKWFVGLSAGLVLAVYSFYPGDKPSYYTPVVGMPEQPPQPSLAPYRGPHPSALQRPAETFNFPIRLGQVGPVQPLFAGPLQYPFLCGVRASGLGQPLVDNYQRWGVPVYSVNKQGQSSEKIKGYSKDCLTPTQATYYYNRAGTEDFYPLAEANNDIARIDINGKPVDFIVRVESGVINRFIYLIVALKGERETLAEPDNSHWNGRLIYQFRGGVGIGYRQGRASPSVVFKRRFEQLSQGYAVLYSSGTQTSNHYNMWLSEDTALRLKKQFVALYGKPLYTIGIGGSGGAVQQFLLAQNNPDIIDAAIAEYAYPDMITQTPYAMDCELLEYYFDVVDRDNPRWQQWSARSLVEGLNANDTQQSRFRWMQRLSQLKLRVWPNWNDGETECVSGWRGLTPLVHNPVFTHNARFYAPEVSRQVQWTHWNDLKYFYGTDENGYANSLWDNVGVQYGLVALRKNQITVQEFLNLNASIGGWKPQHQMGRERFWFLNRSIFPVQVSVWSHRNMVTGSLQQPAQRSEGKLEAIRAAYHSGHVFLGHLPIPLIDLRHYLETELDMHHLSASLSVRQRMLRAQGHADNHLIWVTDKPHKGETEAFAVMDQWLLNTDSGQRPAAAVDTCFDSSGSIIAAGSDSWDGDWNQRPPGRCLQVYPAFSQSRYQAGADVAGDVLKCYLQPLQQAIDNGVYGEQPMQDYLPQLQRIFPGGVCDYDRGDRGRPSDLLLGSRLLPVREDAAEQLAKREPGEDEPRSSGGGVPAVIELSLDNVAADVEPQASNKHL